MAKTMNKVDQAKLLASMHRVLKRNGVVQPVMLTLPASGGQGKCVRWICRTVGGQQRCGWEEVPC